MNRTAALFAALALVVAGVAVPAAGSAPVPTDAAAQLDASAGEDAPGARLAGVVAVQGAEVESDLQDRTFGIRIAKSASNGSKAAVVADRLTTIEEDLATVEARQRALERAREDGNVSQARYNAEVAALAARSAALEQQLDRTDAVAGELPAATLEANGVNASAIDELRTRARDLHGPEVAAIARSIAGPGAGLGLSAAGNATAGPPDRPTPSGPQSSPPAPSDGDAPDGANVTARVDGPGGGGP